VNAIRLTNFDSAIVELLGSEQLQFFRDVVTHFVNEYDAPELDVAAALALLMQGDEPMLLQPDPEPESQRRETRKRRENTPDDGERPERVQRREPATHRGARSGDYTTYRIGLGKRQGVSPRAIVGALSEQIGINGQDLGRITVREHFSLVELPSKLPSREWKALQTVRIAGQPANITADQGPRRSSGSDPRSYGEKPRTYGDRTRRGEKPRGERAYGDKPRRK
jgi:ATP-dependent RNA helicase DeaD